MTTTDEVLSRADTPDSIAAAAVDVARAAAVEEAGPGSVGEYVGPVSDGDRLVTHLFECRDEAYRGWRWGVQVVRAARAKDVTVNDVYRLPGPESLLAPSWVPWADRIRPGDLGVGDLLPAAPDDERLALAIEDVDSETPLMEWGLGRARVLSFVGRVEAAERWYDGDAGPQAPQARHAPAPCVSCAFFVPLSGPLGFGFGACGNEFSPDDGRVVAVNHGCGAHSEGSADVAAMGASPGLVDEFTFEVVPDDEPAADDVTGLAADEPPGALDDELDVELADEPDGEPGEPGDDAEE
ncbi:MAG TPA: DUF3027 domain-containing protein [Frankiaceae bacterium]|nr:DUF3027 domain-containing protein [Frankiaceae bacterium]